MRRAGGGGDPEGGDGGGPRILAYALAGAVDQVRPLPAARGVRPKGRISLKARVRPRARVSLDFCQAADEVFGVEFCAPKAGKRPTPPASG